MSFRPLRFRFELNLLGFPVFLTHFPLFLCSFPRIALFLISARARDIKETKEELKEELKGTKEELKGTKEQLAILVQSLHPSPSPTTDSRRYDAYRSVLRQIDLSQLPFSSLLHSEHPRYRARFRRFFPDSMHTLPPGADEKDVAALFLDQISNSSLGDRVVDGRNYPSLAESRKPDIPHYFPTKPHTAFHLASLGDQKRPRTASDTFTAEEIGHIIGFGGLYLSCCSWLVSSCLLCRRFIELSSAISSICSPLSYY